MADVVLGLAAAIVKAAIFRWTRDNEFASSIAALVSDKVSGELEQRRARRFFEDLEVPVARHLAATGSSVFASLPDNERTAAILAAAASFGRVRLTGPDLISRDLDPLSLERHVRSADPGAARDLSDAATSLYGRLVSDGCAYVIEIADKLPLFQAGAFAEVLRRERQILDRVDAVLDRIPNQVGGASDEARFVTACRRHIATRLDRLELFGLDFESGWYPLSVAYVSLRADQQDGTGSEAVEDRLAAAPRTLLTGRAGSGKTTVLQWLAVSAARSSFTGALADLNGYFPFYLRMRDYVGKPLPWPEDFLTAMAPLLAPEAPHGWARARLDSGRALVLVDGADELPAAQRPGAARWLADLVERFPDVVYVVCARPSAVPAGWLGDLGFRQSSLEPMPPALIEEFIRNWHEATRQQLTDTAERQRLDGYERALLSAITGDRFLRDLADTPLLAGLLCALNRHLLASMPRRRSEIYERALVMLDQRDRARGIRPDVVAPDTATKTHVLAGLALWMVRNGESEVSFRRATDQITRSLAGIAGNQEVRPREIFRHLLDRSGLLREPVTGQVDFMHRTFQEFLAAKAAVDSDAIGELVAHAGDDQWGEVIVLAAGQANQPQTGQLLRGLLRRSWLGQQQYVRRVLAVACLQEVRSLDPAVRREVESIIPQLLPPQSMEQAEQLAAAGEPLIPLLKRHWSGSARLVPPCIRAASLVGGDAALALIRDLSRPAAAGYHRLEPDARDELIRAWQYFDLEKFGRDVLSGLTFDRVSVPGPQYVAALGAAARVTELSIDCPPGRPVDLALLAELRGLRRLHLFGLAQLRETAGDLAVPGLTAVSFHGHFPGADLMSLPRLPDVDDLLLADAPNLVSMAGITRLRNLADLSAQGCGRLLTIRHLSGLPALRLLHLHRATSLDLSGYRPPPRGITIVFTDCGTVDLEPLAGCPDVCIEYDRTSLRNAELLGARSEARHVRRRLSGPQPPAAGAP